MGIGINVGIEGYEWVESESEEKEHENAFSKSFSDRKLLHVQINADVTKDEDSDDEILPARYRKRNTRQILDNDSDFDSQSEDEDDEINNVNEITEISRCKKIKTT